MSPLPPLRFIDHSADLTARSTAEFLLMKVQQELTFMSSDLIRSIEGILTKIASLLHSAHNECQPLFRLPTEILSKILENVPATSLSADDTFWLSTAVDSSMLLPVTRTCRRLREIALSHSYLWRTISNKRVSHIPTLISRSRNAPLNVIAYPGRAIPAIFNMFSPSDPSRIRELHIFGMDFQAFKYLCNILRSPFPALESITLGCPKTFDWTGLSFPLSAERTPRLRYLSLTNMPCVPEHGLPSLTHVALASNTGEMHSKLIAFLTQCHSLQSLAIDGSEEASTTARLPDVPSPLTLDQLRRVSLRALGMDTIRYYMAHIPSPECGPSVELLESYNDDADCLLQFLLLSRADGNGTLICFAVHEVAPGSCQWPMLSMSVTSGGRTRRVAKSSLSLRLRGTSGSQWFTDVLSSSPGPFGIQEVWLSNVGSLYPAVRPDIMSPLSFFPALETAVIVVDYSFHLLEEPLDLRLLPSAYDPSFAAHNLTTLRLACGFSDHTVTRRRSGILNVDLSRILDDLASGAYSYLQRLVLQITPHVRVDDSDLERLRAYIPVVELEHVDELPSIPVDEDPARRGRKNGSLW